MLQLELLKKANIVNSSETDLLEPDISNTTCHFSRNIIIIAGESEIK